MPRFLNGLLPSLGTLLVAAQVHAADPPVTVEQVLAIRPVRSGTEIETPAAADIKQCRVEAERLGNASGWVVYGPQGQVLRRFLDSNGDDRVDEFRYFNHGMEVYRELDTNGNDKRDQFRWLGSGGTRWGVDANEDGKIDRWLRMSAEETTLEAVRAMAAKDPAALQTLMITAEDVKALGISAKVGERLLGGTKDIPARLTSVLSASKTIQPSTQWERFDCSMRVPAVLGAVPGKWDQDLFVYENVMAMVLNGQEPGFVQMGELVRVGDVWKLTRLPQPVEGNELQPEVAILLQESLDSGSTGTAEGLTPEGQKLVEQLKELDDQAPGPNAPVKEVETYNLKRAEIVQKLAQTVTSATEKELWWRQLIEGIAAESHKGAFPGGPERLAALETELQTAKLDNLVPFTRFRRLLVDFASKMQAATEAAERQRVQEAHLTSLRDFVEAFPRSEEAPEAMWQVATTIEFNGNLAAAEKWYADLAAKYPTTMAGKRAKGAVTRLGLKGKELPLKGPALGGKGQVDVSRLKGKVVAVVFWASWFRPSLDEMPQLVELYKTHQKDGFEIVGVNLDTPDTPVTQLLQENKATWPQIQDAGGMETGMAAVDYGIIAPSTMFLIGKDGKVISSSASLDDLTKLVPELVKK
jgi:thiol-disulfide isomerase/thioredoxin